MSDNITLPREVAEGALEALEYAKRVYGGYSKEAKALRAALADPEQKPEPAFWRYKGNPPIWNRHKNTWIDHYYFATDKAKALQYDNNPQPLYVAPPDTEALHRENERLRKEAEALRSILGYALRGAVWEDKLICYCDDEDRVQHYRVEIRLPVPESAADKSPEAALARLIEQETALRREDKT